jgi:hypothetical protein
MNENTFLSLGNNDQASQPMGMDPMGGDASSMPQAPGANPMMGTDPDGGVVGEQGAPGDPNAMVDPNAMGGDPNAMGGDPNAPVMGANAFDGGSDADVSGDPEKKAESLAGQLASIFRNDLANDGINKHEDKKKEVLGMIASAIVDGMSEEDKNSMVEYLSDKLNGAGESDGDDSSMEGEDQDMGEDDANMMPEDDPNAMGGDPNAMGGDPNMMGGDDSQQMAEARVNEVVSSILREFTGNDLTKKKPTHRTKVDQEEKKGYKSAPYMTKK